MLQGSSLGKCPAPAQLDPKAKENRILKLGAKKEGGLYGTLSNPGIFFYKGLFSSSFLLQRG